MARISSFLILVFCLIAPPVQAQNPPAQRLRVEAGYSVNHDGSDKGLGGAVGYVRDLTFDGALRLETGLIAGPPYLGALVGLEYRIPQRSRFGVVLRGGGGLLLEDGFTGLHLRGGGGIEYDLSSRIALRATAQGGYHGGTSGPHSFYLGVDYVWR